MALRVMAASVEASSARAFLRMRKLYPTHQSGPVKSSSRSCVEEHQGKRALDKADAVVGRA